MSVSNPSVYQNVDPDIIEIVKRQIELYRTVVCYSLTMAGRQEEAEEFSRIYYTDLIQFSLYVMRLDGSVSEFEAEMLNLLFGSKKSARELDRLTAQFDQENMAAYARRIPESVTILVEMLDRVDGEDAFDPMAIPQLYLALAGAIGEADGVFDESEAEGARTFVENLIAYVVSVVGEPDAPLSSATMSRETALALLGLTEEELTPQAIKKAYRNAMQLNHPDRHPNDENLRKYAEEQCRRINEARDVLMKEIGDAQAGYPSGAHDKPGYWQSSSSQATSGNSGPSRDDKSAASEVGAEQESPKESVHRHQEASSADEGTGSSVASSDGSFMLTSWKTSVGFSVLGTVTEPFVQMIAVVLMLLPLAEMTGLSSTAYLSSLSAYLVMFVKGIIQFVYAVVVYPSYFKSKPLLKSSRAISFCNFFFSNVAIGPLWNSNLTKSRTEGCSRKGVSCIVQCVFLSLSLVATACSFFIVWGPVLDGVSSHPATYSNYNAGISVSYPDNWTNDGLSEQDDAETVLLRLRPENTRTVAAGVSINGELTKGEFETLTAEDIRAVIPDDIDNWTEESARKTSIGDDDYWVLIGQGVVESEEGPRPIKLAWWFTAQNGLVFCFEFHDYLAGEGFDQYYRDFEGIVASAQYDIA